MQDGISRIDCEDAKNKGTDDALWTIPPTVVLRVSVPGMVVGNYPEFRDIRPRLTGTVEQCIQGIFKRIVGSPIFPLPVLGFILSL